MDSQTLLTLAYLISLSSDNSYGGKKMDYKKKSKKKKASTSNTATLNQRRGQSSYAPQ